MDFVQRRQEQMVEVAHEAYVRDELTIGELEEQLELALTGRSFSHPSLPMFPAPVTRDPGVRQRY